MGTEEVSTYRNRWVVEKAGFLAQRAVAARVFRDSGISAEDGAKRHPELTGTYLKLQIAKGVAEKEIAEPTDRRRFVDRMREALALAIEAGEPLQPVRMQDRPPQRAERRQRERNLEPTR